MEVRSFYRGRVVHPHPLEVDQRRLALAEDEVLQRG
jgi:hypothetical protein